MGMSSPKKHFIASDEIARLKKQMNLSVDGTQYKAGGSEWCGSDEKDDSAQITKGHRCQLMHVYKCTLCMCLQLIFLRIKLLGQTTKIFFLIYITSPESNPAKVFWYLWLYKRVTMEFRYFHTRLCVLVKLTTVVNIVTLTNCAAF